MTPEYKITAARPSDLPRLPAIELAAARLLAGHAPESVLTETTSQEELQDARRRGHLWVALADDVPVGFAHAEILEPGVAHLEEIDVHPEHARRGLGTSLVMAVCAWAAAGGYRAVTLTTFRDVPFNMPFYARLGFEVIPPAELSPALRSVVQAETRRGLNPARRVAMRRACVPSDQPMPSSGILTADMKRVVGEQRLGFVATVCPDGTPNLSPKGTTAVWDDDHLVFANIRSPGTIANLRRNASVEVNVVDPFVRKGYRFKGVASVLESGALYDKAIAFYLERGSQVSVIREVVLIRVQRAQPIDSPAYDFGYTEDDVRDRWERHFQSLRPGKPASALGEPAGDA